jgi:hypothetical protein
MSCCLCGKFCPSRSEGRRAALLGRVLFVCHDCPAYPAPPAPRPAEGGREDRPRPEAK